MDKFIISKQNLKTTCDTFAKTLVGQVMKRFELFDDKDIIKKEVKELIYENSRNLRGLLQAFSSGVKFRTKQPKEQD